MRRRAPTLKEGVSFRYSPLFYLRLSVFICGQIDRFRIQSLRIEAEKKFIKNLEAKMETGETPCPTNKKAALRNAAFRELKWTAAYCGCGSTIFRE